MVNSALVDVVDFLTTPARQRAVLEETDHRPWPLPEVGSWVMAQTWDDLLFAHWPVPIDAIERHVPSALPVDTFDGAAWVAITPFRVTGLRLRASPPFSTFLELNARTYVTLEDKPGIWFFSLDASSRLAVAAARRWYRLPYFHARMSAERTDGGVRYASERRAAGERPAGFRATYEPLGEPFQAMPGSLEHFLAERYCLYTAEGDRVLRADIHHPPWPLRTAGAAIEANTMAPPGIPTDGEPVLHYAERQDVLIWPLARLEGEAVG